MELKCKRVGIMGGTFDPIHIGHLLLAECAREEYHLDEVLFMPTGIPYMKSDNQVTSAQKRAFMVSLAIKDNPFFKLSLVEVEQAKNTYTYETLSRLHQMYENTHFFFIMGADSLFSIESWKYPQKIFGQCTILVAVRDELSSDDIANKINDLKEQQHAEIYLLPAKNIELSSTDIRERLKQNRSIRYMISDSVINYIKEQGLYETI